MTPLPPDQWDPALQHVIDDMSGRPLNIHCLLANHPELLKAWWNYRMYLVRGGDLPQRDCELVILRISVLTRKWYEWSAHVVRGLAAGMSMEEIERVAAGPAASGWGKKDSILLSAVDSLFNIRRIDSATLTSLKTYFSRQQIMDLISIHGMYVTIACMIGTWEIQIEDAVASCLPGDVTEESFAKLISATHGN